MHLAWEQKPVTRAGDRNLNCNLRTWNGLQKIWKWMRTVGNRGKNRNHSELRFVEIVQNTEKGPKETCCHSDSSENPPANTGG